MKARVVALLLTLAIAPNVAELAELVVHYATYGDIADSPGDLHETEPLGVGEHGCSGMFHLGPCQGGQLAAPALAARQLGRIELLQRPALSPMPGTLHGLAPPAPELRPPIV